MMSSEKAKLTSLAWGDAFYKTSQWRSLRERALILLGSACCRCGNPNEKESPEVDHIKPRSQYPELALTLTNLQVLCKTCNGTKGDHHSTDYRTKEQKQLVETYVSLPRESRPAFIKAQRIITAVGQQEFNRRRKQRQLERKKNPRKPLSKKVKKEQLNLQVMFLAEIRIAQYSGTIVDVINKYREQHGNDVVAQLIKRCNIEHWIV